MSWCPSPGLALGVQLTAACGGIFLLAACPPATGDMLLLPLRGDASAALPHALDHGALLVGEGPLRGSFVVRGQRRTLMPAMLSTGVLVLAAPNGACGGSGKLAA